MKNRLLLGALLIGTASLFTACSDDNDSNPTLIQPTEFTLNTPTYIDQTVDLKNTEALQLSWSQPKYTADNAPLQVTYEIQVSPTNSFTVSTAQAEADKQGKTVADYANIARTTTMCKYSLLSADLDKALQTIGKWQAAEDVPAIQNVFVRIHAYISENGKQLNSIISTNEVKLSVSPYFEIMKEADPILWYMVGSCIGSAEWDNGGDASIGKGLVPLFKQANEKYDKATGAGVIAFTGFFPQGGEFKFIKIPGNWDDDKQINYTKVKDAPSYIEDKGDFHNIGIAQSGYYTIRMNTTEGKEEVTFEKYEKDVKVYEQLCVAGTMNEWGDDDMTPVWTLAGENHVWSFVVKGADHMKVKTKGSWDTNWGYRDGLQGEGDKDGNLVIPGKDTDKYLLLFNDITGDYLLIKQK